MSGIDNCKSLEPLSQLRSKDYESKEMSSFGMRSILVPILIVGLVCPRVEADETDCEKGGTYSLMEDDRIEFRQSAPRRRRRRRARRTIRPPKLSPDIRIETFGCQRKFRLRSRDKRIDSFHKIDAERLRPYMSSVSQAEAYLNDYQRTRRNAQIAAYAGTFGLVAAVGSVIVGNSLTNSTGQISETGDLVRKIGGVSGLAITVASFFYGFGVLKTNEENLALAVKSYNSAVEKRKGIELRFSTDIELKDLVIGN